MKLSFQAQARKDVEKSEGEKHNGAGAGGSSWSAAGRQESRTYNQSS